MTDQHIKVVVPYIPARIQDDTKASLDKYAPWAQLCNMHGDGRMGGNDSDYNYGRLLHKHFKVGKAFVLIEQDIILHEGVIPEFESCSHDWCSFPYSTGDRSRLTESLGCVRYSARALKLAKAHVPYLRITPWWACDGVVARILHDVGLTVHTHYPLVGHNHNHIEGSYVDTREDGDFRRVWEPEALRQADVRTEKVDPLKAIRSDMGGMRYVSLHGMWEQRYDQRWDPLQAPCPDCTDIKDPHPKHHSHECPRVGTPYQYPDKLGHWAPLPEKISGDH